MDPVEQLAARPHVNDVSHLRWLTCAGTVRAASDLDRLVDGSEQVRALAPDVRGVDAPGARRLLGERHDLVGRRHTCPARRSGRSTGPAAPASIASATMRRICVELVGGGRPPIAVPSLSSRTAPWPISAATFTAGRAASTRVEVARRTSRRPSVDGSGRRRRRPRRELGRCRPPGTATGRSCPRRRSSRLAGSSTPSSGSTKGATSEWLCTSMKPGASTSRSPSIDGWSSDRSRELATPRAIDRTDATAVDADRRPNRGRPRAVDDRAVVDPRGRARPHRSRRCGPARAGLRRFSEEDPERGTPALAGLEPRPPAVQLGEPTHQRESDAHAG